ncbi:CPBP family intramembrane metalloprotease [Microbacterium maritypicum]|uniref:CPBP family intramembrane glutamic endopeptidase n=1 Tax=Microbacterium maritypicum TaxID=33918 RepID=UPI001B31E4CE|nr:type II CAAX endopeptidase family protein [Microbacterium liquefaciens]MBP5803796.1 CPBP family intramembrane metalloprotease [Microbacterium liquefaciens]
MNDQTLHTRRVPWTAVIVFVAVSFALAWLVALPLWLGDGLAEPSSVLLLPVVMFTPAVAALVVTFVMRVPARGQRARFLGLWPMRPAKRVIWLMVAGWLVPPLLVGLGILLSAALGFVQLDLTFAAFAAELEKAVPAGTPLPPVQVIVFAQLAMIPVGGLFNSLFAFGEELGWRGWLLPALRPLGTWPALILSGVIWGAWHSPVILLGYNFGRTDLTGVLFMIGGCVAWGILLGWVRLRSASVWPAVIAHGSLNAAAGFVLIVAATQPDMALAGPLGVATWVVLALLTVVLVLTGQFRAQPELADAPGRLLSAPRS